MSNWKVIEQIVLYSFSGKGTFIIGQEQDSEGGSFSPGETFVGSLTQLNVWDRELSLVEIDKLRYSCEDFHGNVISWPDVRTSLKGNLAATTSNFCQGKGKMLDD